MEIVPSTLQSYIKIYDKVMSENNSQVFLRICKEHLNFKDAGVVASKENTNVINKDIRDVQAWSLINIGENSRTNVFWANYFCFKFNIYLDKYANDNQITSPGWSILDMQVLKYEKNGKYNFHVDHGSSVPRTVSGIYFLNDDYEGGELCFKFPGNQQELIVEKKSNRLIMWPSNFLYPHAVKPVTKGERYSVVLWAL